MRSEELFAGIGSISDKWITEAGSDEALASAVKMKKAKKPLASVVGYEMRKILSARYLWIFLLVMLLINSAIAWTSVKSTRTASENRMIARFVEGYFAAPEEYDAHYAKILAFNEEQNELMKQAIASGNDDFVPERYPNKYSTVDNISDESLFRMLYRAIEEAGEYPDKIKPIIDSAQRNLESLPAIGAGEGDYVYRYQMKIIELYGELLRNTRIGVEYIYGWEEYFSYATVNFFIAVTVIMFSALVFAQEKQNGFLSVLRSTHEGRMTTALGKLLTLVIASLLTVVIFTLSTFAVFGMRSGYSSPVNALQALGGFTLAPYPITVGEYFLASFAIKILTFLLLSFAVAAISVAFSNYAVIFVGGFTLWGTSFLLYSNVDSSRALKLLNLAGAAETNGLFERFGSLNIFGALCGYLPFLLVIFAALTVICAVFCAAMHTRGFVGISFAFIDTAKAELRIAVGKLSVILSKLGVSKKHEIRSFSSSLVSAEIFKSLISSRFIIALVLILCVKTAYSAELYSAPKSYSDEVYYEYMTHLEGELTDEKLGYIRAEREDIDSILRQREQMQNAYRDGEIDFNEYYDYLARYNYAESRNELLKVIEEHAKYLAEADNGGWFVYDTGWQKLYSGDADLFLYTAILLLLAGIFASEYFSRGEKGGFARILRSTKKGREQTFSAKLISAAIMSLTLTVITSAIDIISVFGNYEMPALSAPIVSIREFAALTPSLTVGGYMAVFLVLRITGALLMAMLVCALSELLCRYLPVLGTVIVLTLLPAFCVGFGISAAEPLNFLNLLAGTPILINSAETALFGSDWGMLAIWITAAAAAVGGIMMPARKMYVK